jgi:DNA-binding response OmpR family regulator
MKIMLISKDSELHKDLIKFREEVLLPIELFCGASEPLDIMSAVCTQNPALIVLDDDFIQPRSAHLLQSIRKVQKSLDIIFLTSNNSIELGKEITSLAVQYYAIKPISGKELMASINSILKHRSTHN